LCGTSDHSIQIQPPPIILRSAQVVMVNDDKNISLAKPKTPKKAVQSPQKLGKKKSIPPEEITKTENNKEKADFTEAMQIKV